MVDSPLSRIRTMTLPLSLSALALAAVALPASAQELQEPCVAGPFHRLTRAYDGAETVTCTVGGNPVANCFCAQPGSGCACPKGHSHPTIDDLARRVAFDSAAVNVVDPALLGGVAPARQIYVLDRDPDKDGCYAPRPTPMLVSRNATTGAPGNADSEFACISGTGRMVAFTSLATNLLAGPDGNAGSDVFVRNLVNGTLVRVSIPDPFSFGAGVPPSGSSQSCWTDRRARRIVFQSTAALDPRDPAGSFQEDVYLHDRDFDMDGAFDEQQQLFPVPGVTTELISVRFDGLAPGNGPSNQPHITGSGRFVAYTSEATDLLDRNNDGIPDPDNNGSSDIFVLDRLVNVLQRVSLRSGGILEADGPSSEPSVAEDGRSVAFRSSASNLIPGRTLPGGQVYLRNRSNNTILLVSTALDGSPAATGCRNPRISPNGRFVAFTTAAQNLLPPGVDTNGRLDLYVYDRDQDANGVFDDSGIPLLVRLSVGHQGQQGNGIAGGNTDFSADGAWIPFMSEADNLLPAGVDANCERDVYLVRNPLF